MSKLQIFSNHQNKTEYLTENINSITEEILYLCFKYCSHAPNWYTTYLTHRNLKYLINSFKNNDLLDELASMLDKRGITMIVLYIRAISLMESAFKEFLFPSFLAIESSHIRDFEDLVISLNRNKLSKNIIEEAISICEKSADTKKQRKPISIGQLERVFKFKKTPSTEIIFLIYDVIGNNKNNLLEGKITIDKDFKELREKEKEVIKMRHFIMHPTSFSGLEKCISSFDLLTIDLENSNKNMVNKLTEKINKNKINFPEDKIFKIILNDVETMMYSAVGEKRYSI